MKLYSTKFLFRMTGKMKKDIKRRSRELGIPMADYIRTLIKVDLTLEQNAKEQFNEQRNDVYIDNLNKKLSGFFKGV